ncbi:hypothetical protein WN48_07461 [Eufriesea mexicana]|uniref:Uncharacterized protein n=1 Tax=Eufriesea mexicana TaxID=516756 RepID=A0A310SYH3_9HYME|nr:hypothetical protein WN48_07461 [Eufriesea mexicana]
MEATEELDVDGTLRNQANKRNSSNYTVHYTINEVLGQRVRVRNVLAGRLLPYYYLRRSKSFLVREQTSHCILIAD